MSASPGTGRLDGAAEVVAVSKAAGAKVGDNRSGRGDEENGTSTLKGD